MEFELQISLPKLQSTLASTLKRVVLSRDLDFLAGVMDLPFDGLLARTTEPGVVHHVEIHGVTAQHASRVAPATEVSISIPPRAIVLVVLPSPAVSVMAPPVLIRAIVRLQCVRLADLRAAREAPVPPERFVHFDVRLNLTLGQPVLAGRSLQMTPTLINIELGQDGLFPDPETIPGADGERLRALVAQLNSPETLAVLAVIDPIALNVGGIIDILAGAFVLWNAGVALGPGVLVLRMQFAAPVMPYWVSLGPSWQRSWQSFFDGGSVSRVGAGDWSLYFPRSYFAHQMESTIVSQIAASPRLVLNRDNMPRSSWSATGGPLGPAGVGCIPGGVPSMRTVFSVSAKGVCLPWGTDIDVNCALGLTLSLPRPSVLRADVHFDHTADEGDTIACAIGASFLISAAAFVIGGTLGGWVGAAIGAAVGGVVGGVGFLVGAYTVRPPSFATEMLHAVEGSDRDYYMEITLPASSDAHFGGFMPSLLTACNDGMAVGGVISVADPGIVLLSRVRQDDGFRWTHASNTCPEPPLDPQIEAFSKLEMSRGVGTSTLPVCIYGIQILEPSLPVGYGAAVRVERLRWPDGLELTFHVDATVAKRLRDRAAAESVASPGFELLVQTSAGARLLFVHGMGSDLSDASYEDRLAARRASCDGRRRLAEELSRRAREIAPHLHREPPVPDIQAGDVIAREWTFAVSGLARGQLLRLGYLSFQNAVLDARVTIPPDMGGRARARFWERDTGAGGLALDIHAEPALQPPTRAAIAVGCMLYRRASVVEFDGVYRDHLLLRQGPADDAVLAIASADGLLAYGATIPASPSLRWAVPQLGLRSMTAAEDGVLCWGDAGLLLFNRAGIRHPLVDVGVHDVLLHRRAAIVVTTTDIRAVDIASGKSRQIAPAGGRVLAIIGHALVTAFGDGFRAYDLADPFRPQQVAATKELLAAAQGRSPAAPPLEDFASGARKLGRLAALPYSSKVPVVELYEALYFEAS